MRAAYWLSVLTFVLFYVVMLLVRSRTVALERQSRDLRERGLDAGLFEA